MQKGSRTTSTRRTGSQKLTLNPNLGGLPQKQAGFPPGLAVSSWSIDASVAPPILRGNMHDQQMSVIGLANLPLHVAAWAAAIATIIQMTQRAALQTNLINTKSFPFLRHDGWGLGN